MIRRRRRSREIPFSFDSFLDVVANVCGIIIRLILVAWVGARSYHAGLANQAVEAAAAQLEPASIKTGPIMLPPLSDPLESALAQHREELARQQQRLLEQMRQWQLLEANTTETEQKLAAITASEAAALQD